MRELYPEVPVLVVYQRDFLALLEAHGLDLTVPLRRLIWPGGRRGQRAGDRPLRHSPLHAAHVALGAKMVPFGGWEMPLAYPAGTVAEHRACRESAVAFDVSHLGTVRVDRARRPSTTCSTP